MISLRGLTDHTLKSYSTYIRAYLDYLSGILQKNPEDFLTAPSTMRFHSFPCVSLMNTFLMFLQKKRHGSLFLLCLIWSRRRWSLSCILPDFVSVKCVICVTRMLTVKIWSFISHTLKAGRIAQSTRSSFQGISMPMRNGWDGGAGFKGCVGLWYFYLSWMRTSFHETAWKVFYTTKICVFSTALFTCSKYDTSLTNYNIKYRKGK